MRRCLIVSNATPAATGGSDWRRFGMLARNYQSSNMMVAALVLGERDPDRAQARLLRNASDQPAFARHADAREAVSALDLRHDFDVIHIAAPDAPPYLAAGLRAVRLLDLGGDWHGTDALAAWQSHIDLFVAFEADEARQCRDAGMNVIEAPYLHRAHRLSRGRIPGARLLAGCWVEAAPDAIAAVRAFFDAVRNRGGGFAPHFIVAGPGAGAIDLPQLPYPIMRLGPDVEERAFYRGIDIAVCPDLRRGGSNAPRYDVMTALELGATPLVSSSALTGLRSLWRLPDFENLTELAEYLFERGRDMREGGLMADLRARADWTWSSLSGAAADQRKALMAGVSKEMQNKGGDI